MNVVVLKYSTTKVFGTGSTTFDYNVFRTNSIYDPDQTSGGHQPMYHDQWANIYKSYEVISSRIVVKGSSVPGSGSSLLALETTTDVETAVTLDTIRERPGVVSKAMNSYQQAVLGQRWIQSTRSPTDIGRYQADFGSNPVQSEYYQISVYSLSGSNLAAASQTLMVDIYYTVRLYNLNNITTS